MTSLPPCENSENGIHSWAIMWDPYEENERERCLKCGVYADNAT